MTLIYQTWHLRHDDEIWTAADVHIALCANAEIATQIIEIHNTALAARQKQDYFLTHCTVCGSTEELYNFPSGPKCNSPDCVGF